MKHFSIILIVCVFSSQLFSMDKDEGKALLSDIELMRMHHESKASDIVDKFNTVLHLPIISKNAQDICVADVISKITKDDYAELAQKYPEKKKIVEQSFLWTMATLPKEIQRKIAWLMMDRHEDIAEAFLRIPIVYLMGGSSSRIYALHVNKIPYKEMINNEVSFCMLAKMSGIGATGGAGGGIAVTAPATMLLCPGSNVSLIIGLGVGIPAFVGSILMPYYYYQWDYDNKEGATLETE